jgi:hypothetical protein
VGRLRHAWRRLEEASDLNQSLFGCFFFELVVSADDPVPAFSAVHSDHFSSLFQLFSAYFAARCLRKVHFNQICPIS